MLETEKQITHGFYGTLALVYPATWHCGNTDILHLVFTICAPGGDY